METVGIIQQEMVALCNTVAREEMVKNCIGFGNCYMITTMVHKPIEIYSLSALESRSPKPVLLDPNLCVSKAVHSLDSTSCLWELLAFLDLWPHHSNLQGQDLPISLCPIVTTPPPLGGDPKSPSASSLRIHVIVFRSHLDNPDKLPISRPLTNTLPPATPASFKAISGNIRRSQGLGYEFLEERGQFSRPQQKQQVMDIFLEGTANGIF